MVKYVVYLLFYLSQVLNVRSMKQQFSFIILFCLQPITATHSTSTNMPARYASITLNLKSQQYNDIWSQNKIICEVH